MTQQTNSPRNEAEVRERAESYVSRQEQVGNDWGFDVDSCEMYAEIPIIRDLLVLLAEKDKVIEKLPVTADNQPVLVHCPYSAVYWKYPEGTIIERCVREIGPKWNAKKKEMEWGIMLSAIRPNTQGMLTKDVWLNVSESAYSTREAAEAAEAALAARKENEYE
jgi:hypothetical protein